MKLNGFAGEVLYFGRISNIWEDTGRHLNVLSQLKRAEKLYQEKLREYGEKERNELDRVERRICRKKKLLDQKYEAEYVKIKKEKQKKVKRILEKYCKLENETLNEVTKDIETIEERQNKITLRQFLLKILDEKETGQRLDWFTKSSDVEIETRISTSSGTVQSKLRLLQSEFISKFNVVMGTVPDTNIPAYGYLSRGKIIYLTKRNCDFLRMIMIYDESDGAEYDIVGAAMSNDVGKLNTDMQNRTKEGMYSLAHNPDTKIDEAMVQERLRSLFGMGSAQIADELECVKFAVSQMQGVPCFSVGQRYMFTQVNDSLKRCYAEIEEKYLQYMRLYGEDDEIESAIKESLKRKRR